LVGLLSGHTKVIAARLKKHSIYLLVTPNHSL
jgi:hypothetical protein